VLRKSRNSYSTNGICRVNLLSNSIVGCPFVPFLLAILFEFTPVFSAVSVTRCLAL
jgi:hypothetical protein